MGQTLTEKILSAHLLEAETLPAVGEDIALRIDQTLTQDATGTMAYLEFEAMGIPRVRTELSIAYVDHNTLQTGYENADDHRFIQSVAKKRGLKFSRPGNGICHQVHLERFGVPGKTLIGSDSHTPTGGGIGMLAFGAGGLDVAVAMGGGAYHIAMPKVTLIKLTGKLRPYVSAKDVILEVLRRMTVKGGVGKIIEYGGEGISTLSVPERATITNMGAELGATTSVFPSDAVTKAFLEAQERGEVYVPLAADADAMYYETIEIDLNAVEVLAAKPHMPDNVASVREIGPIKVDQVLIGSCTNSSLRDMLITAAILKGKTVCPSVSLGIAPGSKQVLTMLAECGALADLISAGARILESACGPCIGMGQSPNSGAVSLRTFNRNFEGRSGTADAGVYLVSPETAAVSAITGVLTDPTAQGAFPAIQLPAAFLVNDNMIIEPASPAEAEALPILYGPNIKPFPVASQLPNSIQFNAVLKVGDDITTDHIMPAGAKILPYRSNIPYMSQFCFRQCDEHFAENCKAVTAAGQLAAVIGGANYGQGSSREHAALVPLYLGVRAVIVKSFARIHAANLINAGILPLVFDDPEDYDLIRQGDSLALPDIREALQTGGEIRLENKSNGGRYKLHAHLSDRQRDMLLAGGLLPYTKQGA
ncbi:MAG: aconitate hydratase [Oscillospiraceae bacterium]|nr:aconitate hydratase [Oscillospiraceae bacterium]